MCQRFFKDDVRTCPACDGRKFKPTTVRGIYECVRCGGVHGTCYVGEAYTFRKPFWHQGDSKVSRYFDFELLGSEGITYSHGWVDADSKALVQVG